MIVGGFSYVYLVKEIADTSAGQSLNSTTHGEQRGSNSSGGGRSGSFGNGGSNKGRQNSMGRPDERKEMVLKVTSILSRQQRDIAEKEAKLLSRLSHPSIIKMYDTCYRTVAHHSSGFRNKETDKTKERAQHLILMEYCEGGQALEVCSKLAADGERFDLSTLIIAFGQICNAVSYLHAQRPPIVHRDLKPANFLVKNGAYKLCDFGSAVFGHVDLKTPQARAEAEEVIQKTTTQMFRAPEMVDLYMAKKLTQATDVWALGCCLYSLAFLQNCFEEGSNLAILSRKFKIPDDNPYGEGLVELIDRMLTVDSKARADMTEVILCLSAVYSGRPLPPRKERKEKKKPEKEGSKSSQKKKKNERAGKFRTDGQGIYDDNLALDAAEVKKPAQAKRLDPNSAAARRRIAAGGDKDFESLHNRFDEAAKETQEVNEDLAFSTTANPFASFDNKSDKGGESEGDIFGSFDVDANAESGEQQHSEDVMAAFDTQQDWAEGSQKGEGFDAFASFSPEGGGEATMTEGSNPSEDAEKPEEKRRRQSRTATRPRRARRGSKKEEEVKDDSKNDSSKDETEELAQEIEEMGIEETLENLQATLTAESTSEEEAAAAPESSKTSRRRSHGPRSSRMRRANKHGDRVRSRSQEKEHDDECNPNGETNA